MVLIKAGGAGPSGWETSITTLFYGHHWNSQRLRFIDIITTAFFVQFIYYSQNFHQHFLNVFVLRFIITLFYFIIPFNRFPSNLAVRTAIEVIISILLAFSVFGIWIYHLMTCKLLGINPFTMLLYDMTIFGFGMNIPGFVITVMASILSVVDAAHLLVLSLNKFGIAKGEEWNRKNGITVTATDSEVEKGEECPRKPILL